MKSNRFKWFIRLWLGVASLAAFISGWLFLGHSGKPVDAAGAGANAAQPQIAPLPTLAPLPSINSRSGSAMQPFTQLPVQQFARPVFRSRGS